MGIYACRQLGMCGAWWQNHLDRLFNLDCLFIESRSALSYWMRFSQMSSHRHRGAGNLSTEVARIFEPFDVLFHVLLQMTSLSGGVRALLTSKNTMRVQFLVQCFYLANYFLRYYWFHFVNWSSFVKLILDVVWELSLDIFILLNRSLAKISIHCNGL